MPAAGISTLGHEALDDPHADPTLVVRLLHDIARSNRWFGGASAVRHGLSRLVDPRDHGTTLSLLDIGTGAGDLPRVAMQWAARHQVTVRPFGVERIPCAARLAQSHGVTTLLSCATALPFAERSIDVVLISQMLHHLDREAAVRLLSRANRIARRGVIVADLRNAPLAATGFRVAGQLLGMHRTTVADGVTSLQRAWSEAALAAMCREAGVAGATIARRPIARVVAWWRVD